MKILLVPASGKQIVHYNLDRLKEVLGDDFRYVVTHDGVYVIEVDNVRSITFGSLSSLIERGEP